MPRYMLYPLSQARCHNCGFLAVWRTKDQELEEAPEFYRKNGELEVLGADRTTAPKCFIRKADLQKEVLSDPDSILTYGEAVKKCIQKDRACEAFTLWRQGFTPKEHRQMLLTEEMLREQRRHANHSLGAAIATAAFTGLSVIVGAVIAHYSAQTGANATIEAAKMQIEAQRELAKQEKPPQPINITVQMPEAKTKKTTK